MAEKTLDLGIDPVQAELLRKEATKEPCFGGCGLSYEEAGGGWFTFEVVEGQQQLAPRWDCDACIQNRFVDGDNKKAGSGPTMH